MAQPAEVAEVAETANQAVPSWVAASVPAAEPMPWCQTCSRFLNPNTLEPDGSCPTCGRVVAAPPVVGEDGTVVEDRPRAPWHFKVLLVLVVLYLGWRLVQMGGWVVHWLTS